MLSLALSAEVVALAEAVLIGFLIGAQREASQGEGHPGVRDFVLVALIGAVAGLLQNPWLIVASLLSVTAMLAVFYFQAPRREGITTEMAALATYCLGFLAATPAVRGGETLAVGAAIVVVAFLEAKRTLHKLVREQITEAEFNDTLRFLAIIFIIYPLLPAGEYGPYGFLAPRKIWAFVILVSAVSYAGYFLAKFLGTRRGLPLTGILGGLASTTAATFSLASGSSREAANRTLYAQAAVFANAIQFPRVLLILAVVRPSFAVAALYPLLAMTAAGVAVGLVYGRKRQAETAGASLGLGNPFRLLPALKFGLLFALVLLATKAAASALGGEALYWASGLAGSLDVDAVALSMADLLGQDRATPAVAVACLLIALAANAVVKSAISAYVGPPEFVKRLVAGFAAMFGAGLAAWLATGIR